jgi:hypothetical protein
VLVCETLQLKRVMIEGSSECITKGEDVREDKVTRWPSACLGEEIKLGA